MKKLSDSMVGWTAGASVVVGLDLGDKESRWKAVNRVDGELREGTVAMNHEAIAQWVLCAPRCRVGQITRALRQGLLEMIDQETASGQN